MFALKIPNTPQQTFKQNINQKYKFVISKSRWVDGESFPGQKKSCSHPNTANMSSNTHPNTELQNPNTELQMTEKENSQTGKEDLNGSKTKTTFFYSNPSRVEPSSHPYPSSALPDHHLVCSVSLLSFASYSHRLQITLGEYFRKRQNQDFCPNWLCPPIRYIRKNPDFD